ncbi:hypothetical protein, partial [Bacillus sp. SIMBA_005]
TERGVDHVDAEVTAARTIGASDPVVGLAWSAALGRPVALDHACRLWRVDADALVPLPGPQDARHCVALEVGPEGMWAASADGGLHVLTHAGR